MKTTKIDLIGPIAVPVAAVVPISIGVIAKTSGIDPVGFYTIAGLMIVSGMFLLFQRNSRSNRFRFSF